MRPLFVAYNHAYNTKVGIRNLTNLVDKFGCDIDEMWQMDASKWWLRSNGFSEDETPYDNNIQKQ